MRYLLFLLAACAGESSVPEGPTIVVTDRGAVSGAAENEVVAWRGVPYAAPPVGELRWRAPAPMPAWDGVRDASSWGSGCVEITTGGQLLGGSEDCLFLNVWTPTTVTRPLPVLVFIHGGFNLNGSSSHVVSGERIYDGAYVAAHGPAIVVTLNYRLGALGYFGGNFAQLDQIAALEWVHKNIAGFGGDPAHVLVFGESAGGAATCALFASPRAAGLFSAALVESGGCVTKPAATAAALDAALVAATGCSGGDSLACLRALPADRIAVAASIDLTASTDRWSSFVDGDVIPESPITAIAAGRNNAVPLVIGTTANEFSTLASHFLAAPIASDAEYRAEVTRRFPQGAARVLARYPSTDYATPMAAFVALMSDFQMTCPTRRAARTAASRPEAVYRYVFAHTYSNGPLRALGAGHALDLPFEFGNLDLAGFTPTATERALSDTIIGYWTRFAASGDPNGNGAPAWPRYDSATDATIVFDDAVTSTQGIRTALCDFWDGD